MRRDVAVIEILRCVGQYLLTDVSKQRIVPSSTVDQSKKTDRYRLMRKYTEDGVKGYWFSVNVTELIRLLRP